MNTKGYFITGTDTEIGKTYTSVSLIKHLSSQNFKVAGLKPVASGCEETSQGLRNSDALLLANAANVELRYQQINRYAFKPAIAPHIAAGLRDISIDLKAIEADLVYAQSKADKVVVEAAGGWLMPLNHQHTVCDLALKLKLPVIAVVGIRLGCINHALLTLHHILQSGAKVEGWVANHLDSQTEYANEQIDSIKARTDVTCLAEIQYKSSYSKVKWAI